MQQIYTAASFLLRKAQNCGAYRWFARHLTSIVSLREATEADMKAIHGWLNAADELPKEVQRDPSVTDWVAIHNGKIVGFVQLVRHQYCQNPYSGYWLFSLYVKSHQRGLGIGEALSKAVIARAFAEGAPTLDLLVFEDNDRAARLYEKLGFRQFIIPDLEPDLQREKAQYGRRRVVMRKQLIDQLL